MAENQTRTVYTTLVLTVPTPADRETFGEAIRRAAAAAGSPPVGGWVGWEPDNDTIADALGVDHGQHEVLDLNTAPSGLWPCGCLVNEGQAHRVGCPVYPAGREGL